MLICILGSFGSGKTLLLAILSTQSIRTVRSNFKINIEKYKELKIIDLLDLEKNTDVYIDEGYTWLESRTSSSILNRYLSYIILQSRKRTIDIYITAQLFSTVDLRFRDNADIIIKCLRKTEGFKYIFYNTKNKTIKSFILPFKKAEKYYELYDTYEIIEPHAKEQLEYKLLLNEPKRLETKIKKICEVIFPSLDKITHDSVKLALLKNNYDINYEKYVYIYLKSKKYENNKD